MNRTKSHLLFPLCGLWIFAVAALAEPDYSDPRQTGEAIEGLKERVGELESTHGDFTLGGAAWLNFEYSSFNDQQKDRLGDFRFDLIRIEARGSSGPWEISAQYRWYEYMDVIHHAWIGYELESGAQIQTGISQVPFGLQPFASHSYWFGVPYYLGFEDDYQAGIKYVNQTGDWDIQAAYYPNPALATPSSNDRYAWNIVTNTDLAAGADFEGDFSPFEEQANRQNDQLNLRLAREVGSDSSFPTELGLSTQYGRLYNEITEDHGDHWALALHSRSRFGADDAWGLELEWISYGFNPENPDGTSDDAVLFGAFLFDSLAAAEGDIYVANLTREFNVDWGPVSHLTCYLNYSVLDKAPSGWADSKLHTTGCSITAGPTFTFVDIIRGKNHNFMGVDPVTAFAQGDPNADWETRFNINIGIYW
ncbi:hypothetical protein VCB98_04660 [Gammaproteobacteria bacterium AB-CW1]|uniref:Phosphate-selective porin O and P n=1 Tax=Natronospira elongata TaxID=3110268 RepID=A0AAP6JDR2_9GAMM|nr:hypothetical protein [Gammaproteobacteria bacterium AB-CW1]